jgi:prepilin-type N-terminal cleavage/methylation domain-containing protein
MRSSNAPVASPRTRRAGFTLTEILLALGVIAIAFVGLLGLFPAGLTASRQAVDSTVIGTILEDLHNRLQGQPLVAGTPAFGPVLYDDHGAFISDALTTAPSGGAATPTPIPVYRAEVSVGTWYGGISPTGTSALAPVTISLYWPVDNNGNAIGKLDPNTNKIKPQTVITYATTTLSGTSWTAIDSNFVPKIEY